jgi:hypothetical protein
MAACAQSDPAHGLPFGEELAFIEYYLCGLRGALRLWRDFFFPRIAEARSHAAWLEAMLEAEAGRKARVDARRVLIFRKKLRPLIKENYRKRLAGEIPDEWFWADKLALRWGMFVDPAKMKEWN